MSFADLPTVRKHLAAVNIPELHVRNVRVALTSVSPTTLPHANLLSGSETVKIIASDRPALETGVLLAHATGLSPIPFS